MTIAFTRTYNNKQNSEIQEADRAGICRIPEDRDREMG